MDKPSGITSARAVSRAKKLLPRKTKIGHTGTLDPMASGLMVLLIGRATRLSRYVTHFDKSYTATARFGAVSSTLDAEGEISSLDAPLPDKEDILDSLPDFTGELRQIPPMTSAIKHKGERLYALHRRGMEVERESRPVTVYSFELVSFDAASRTATFDISCSSGTYVRTLVADLASSIGTGAYLTALRRTSVGHFDLEEASRPGELTIGDINKRIIHMMEVVAHLPVVEVSDSRRREVCNGRSLGRSGKGVFRVECDGELLAIYRDENGEARPEVVLCAE